MFVKIVNLLICAETNLTLIVQNYSLMCVSTDNQGNILNEDEPLVR